MDNSTGGVNRLLSITPCPRIDQIKIAFRFQNIDVTGCVGGDSARTVGIAVDPQRVGFAANAAIFGIELDTVAPDDGIRIGLDAIRRDDLDVAAGSNNIAKEERTALVIERNG